jgi:putative glutamine amidotransferase
MKIAASRASGSDSYARYEPWLRAADETVEVVDLHGMAPDDAVRTLEGCSGLLLTGGPDVDPDQYQQPEKRTLCQPADVDRDALELAVIRRAFELRMPVLGICRGAQILNVAYGGTLVADIPTALQTDIVHTRVNEVDARHPIEVEGGSLIRKLCRVMDGEVNSAHHQSVETLAAPFTTSATSPDGVVEAFEWGDGTLGGKPFLLAVQWHPERMEYDSPFSLPIAQAFTSEVAAYGLLIRR